MSQFDEMYRAQPFTKMFPPPSEERLALLEYGGKGKLMKQARVFILPTLNISVHYSYNATICTGATV